MTKNFLVFTLRQASSVIIVAVLRSGRHVYRNSISGTDRFFFHLRTASIAALWSVHFPIHL
jgi:hypothetical protein